MANHKSAEKAIRQIEKRTLINKSRMSRIKTFIKKVEQALLASDKAKAQAEFKIAQSEIMKGVTKGLLKLNTASRKVSNLSARIKKLAS
jgi:small subunit ribosomal protein S20